MPAGDRTGPMGQGARTGRAKGLCSGNTKPGYAHDENRKGMGRGMVAENRGSGAGRGCRQGRGPKF